MRIHIGASRLRTALDTLEPEDAEVMMVRLFPELTFRRIQLLVRHLDETTVNGSQLTMPGSWDELLGDAPPKDVANG